jgi:hypothetical protein
VRFWHYGEANPVGVSNLAAVGWALRAYLAGADGILLWNVIGDESAFQIPTPTALLLPGERFGLEEPVVSLRVKACRRGQQDVELLAAVARRRGWDRQQVGEVVRKLVGVGGQALGASGGREEAQPWQVPQPAALERLRLALYAALDE